MKGSNPGDPPSNAVSTNKNNHEKSDPSHLPTGHKGVWSQKYPFRNWYNGALHDVAWLDFTGATGKPSSDTVYCPPRHRL